MRHYFAYRLNVQVIVLPQNEKKHQNCVSTKLDFLHLRKESAWMGLFLTKGQTKTCLSVIQVSLKLSVKDIITLKLQSKCYQLWDACDRKCIPEVDGSQKPASTFFLISLCAFNI